MANTPNKNYPLQVTGTNVGIWGGVVNNQILAVLDNNIGGTLNISVTGSANINLTSAQASYLIHNLTGALTGNIQYIFPAAGGFYAISNQTTGNFNVTVNVVGGAGGILVPQGTSATVYVDATAPAVESFIGTQYNFVGGTVTGIANALILSQTFPANFSLNIGTFLTLTPTQFNTGPATLKTPDGSTNPIQKINFTGLSPLVVGDLAESPVILQFNGTVWVALNIIPVGYQMTVSTPQSVTFGNCYTPYVNTAAVNYTIDRTTNLLAYWYIDINAFGGAATIIPNAADIINVNGISLAIGTSFVIPQGASARIFTDANGNLFVNFDGNLLNKESVISSSATTDLGTMASNIGAISGTNAITSFGSSASVSNPFFITRFTGALTLTYNAATLIFPGSANYTTHAGDVFMWKYEGSGVWRCVSYALASGAALVNSLVFASKADMQAATSTTEVVSPAQMQNHPGVAKAWVRFDHAGTIIGSYNVSSVTRTAAGSYTVNFSTNFANTAYSVQCTPDQTEYGAGIAGMIGQTGTLAQGSAQVFTCFTNNSGSQILADAAFINVTCHGTQ